MVKAVVNNASRFSVGGYDDIKGKVDGVKFSPVVFGGRADLFWSIENKYAEADIIILFSNSYELKTYVHETNESYLVSLRRYIDICMERCKKPTPIIVVQEVDSEETQLLMGHIHEVHIIDGINIPIYVYDKKDPKTMKNLARICKFELTRENTKYNALCGLRRSDYEHVHSYVMAFKSLFTSNDRLGPYLIGCLVLLAIEWFFSIPLFPTVWFCGAGCLVLSRLLPVNNFSTNSK